MDEVFGESRVYGWEQCNFEGYPACWLPVTVNSNGGLPGLIAGEIRSPNGSDRLK
jgi:hypothetical protein